MMFQHNFLELIGVDIASEGIDAASGQLNDAKVI